MILVRIRAVADRGLKIYKENSGLGLLPFGSPLAKGKEAKDLMPHGARTIPSRSLSKVYPAVGESSGATRRRSAVVLI